MNKADLLIDQETFITKLALEILEGRSFDVTGKKCAYEALFNNINLNESDQQDQPEYPCDSDAAAESVPAEEDTFILRKLMEIDEETERLQKLALNSVHKFRRDLSMMTVVYTQEKQLAMYKARTNSVDNQCKSIVRDIEKLQNQFVNAERLREVTRNLERLSQAVNLDEPR